jgi:hypothetical protein
MCCREAYHNMFLVCLLAAAVYTGPKAASTAERVHRRAHKAPAGAARPSSSSSASRRRPSAGTGAAVAAPSMSRGAALSGAQVAMAQAAAPQQSMAVQPLLLEQMSGLSDPAAGPTAAASAAVQRYDGVWGKERSPTGRPSQQQRSCSAASDLTAAGPLLSLLAPCGSPTAAAAAGALVRPVGQSRLAGTQAMRGRQAPGLPHGSASIAAAAPADVEPSTHHAHPSGALLPGAAAAIDPSQVAGVGARAGGGRSSSRGPPSSNLGRQAHLRPAPSSCEPEGVLPQGPGLAPPVVPPPAPLGGSGGPFATSAPLMTSDSFLGAAAGYGLPMEALLLGGAFADPFRQQLGLPGMPQLSLQQQGNALLLAAVLTAQQGPTAGLLPGAGAVFAAPAVAAAAAAARAVEEHLSVAFGSSSGTTPFLHHLVQGVPTPGLPPGQVDALTALPALATFPAAAAAAAAGGVLGLPVAASTDMHLAQAFRGAMPMPLPGWLNLSC